VVLEYQADVAPDVQVGNQRSSFGYQSYLKFMSLNKIRKLSFEFFTTVKQPYMNLIIDDNTSIMTIDKNTLTMPLSTEMGMLVSSCSEA
jgi:hypothetical protein